MNLYAYVGGDPINTTDPTGMLHTCTGSIIPTNDACGGGASAYSCSGNCNTGESGQSSGGENNGNAEGGCQGVCSGKVTNGADTGKSVQYIEGDLPQIVKDRNGSPGWYSSDSYGGLTFHPLTTGDYVMMGGFLIAVPIALEVGAAGTLATEGLAAAEGGGAALEGAGASSLYDTSITRAGSQYLNVQTDVGAQGFQSNLISNGYSIVNQTPGATILNNGTNTWTIYTRTSTGMPGAQFFGQNGSIIKYSLGGP
jgi:hypothetical protein